MKTLKSLYSMPVFIAAITLFAFLSYKVQDTTKVNRPFEAILLSSDQNNNDAKIANLLKGAAIQKTRFVFSLDERHYLATLGQKSLANARIVTLKSHDTYQGLIKEIQNQHLPLSLEPAVIKLSTTSMSENSQNAQLGITKFQDLLWGVENTGQAVPLAIDDLTSETVIGKSGEDIGLHRVPSKTLANLKPVTVAVLDTGIDFGHPDLDSQLFENVPECLALAQRTKCLSEKKGQCDTKYPISDYDGNGYPMDCSGWNMAVRGDVTSDIWGNNDARDMVGHGTHVAGILSQVNRSIRILAVKVMPGAPNDPVRPAESLTPTPPQPYATTLPVPNEKELRGGQALGDLVARGLLYALRSDAQVINMSLGWPADVDSALMKKMIDLAATKGALIVTASGNDGTDALIRPCIYETVICIGSHDPDGAISHFSNYGAGVDIAGPGLGILSLFPTNLRSNVFAEQVGYEIKNGTSMAAPYVAGILATLLGTGLSPQEAKARLLLGTRAPSENRRINRTQKPFVQTGNADLSLALKTSPQPLIYPTTKKPILIRWDRRTQQIKFQVTLENLWKTASTVTIKPSIINQISHYQDANLSEKNISLGRFNEQQKKDIQLTLNILSSRFESELLLKFDIEATDKHTGLISKSTRYVNLETVTEVNENTPDAITKPFTGSSSLIAELTRSSYRTVQSLDGDSKQDYFAFLAYDSKTKLILLDERAVNYEVSKTVTIDSPTGTLMTLQRIDLNNDSESDYVLVWKKAPSGTSKYPIFNFFFFDKNLQPLNLHFDHKVAPTASYINATTIITDKFQWITSGNQKVPAWISRGLTPTSEKPSYDPWNPTPLDLPNFRLYFWGPEGLKTISLSGKTPVAFLFPSRMAQKAGDLQVVWVSQEGSKQHYEVSDIINAQSSPLRRLNFGGSRSIRQTMMAPVFDLSQYSKSTTETSGNILGTAFFSDSYRQSERVTGIDNNRLQPLFDTILTAQSKTDSVINTFSVYFDPDLQASTQILSQTIYDIQLHEIPFDGSPPRVTGISLKKFSFMPGFFFQRLFFPTIGKDIQSSRRIPMIYLAQGLGTGPAMEVITTRQEAGKSAKLSRPAWLHLAPANGCTSMGDFIPPTEHSPAAVVFICNNKIIQTPLSF